MPVGVTQKNITQGDLGDMVVVEENLSGGNEMMCLEFGSELTRKTQINLPTPLPCAFLKCKHWFYPIEISIALMELWCKILFMIICEQKNGVTGNKPITRIKTQFKG